LKLSRRRVRLVQSLFILAVLTLVGCGREGPTTALPDKARFCKKAAELADAATGQLAPLPGSTSLAELARRLDAFIRDHRADYAVLDRVAPPEIRPVLRRQRTAQSAFIAADSEAARRTAYDLAVRTGREVTEYEQGIC
jgi:hypothetical protein